MKKVELEFDILVMIVCISSLQGFNLQVAIPGLAPCPASIAHLGGDALCRCRKGS